MNKKTNMFYNYHRLQIEQHVNNMIQIYLDYKIKSEQTSLVYDISKNWASNLKIDHNDIVDIVSKILYKQSDKTKEYFDNILNEFIYYIQSKKHIIGTTDLFKNYLTDLYHKMYEDSIDEQSDSSDNNIDKSIDELVHTYNSM